MSDKQSEHTHITLGLVLGWMFGVIAAVSAIDQFLEGSYLTSFLSLCLVAFLIPPIWEKIQNRFKIKLSGGVKVVIVILILALIGFLTPSTSPGGSTYSQTQTSSQEASGPLLELVSKTGSFTAGGGYFEVQGQVENLSDENLKSIEAVVSVYDSSNNFIASDDSFIDYNPILPGQTSPFSVMVNGNPEIAKFKIEFKKFGGGTIETRDGT